jgi:hypothetical protein
MRWTAIARLSIDVIKLAYLATLAAMIVVGAVVVKFVRICEWSVQK